MLAYIKLFSAVCLVMYSAVAASDVKLPTNHKTHALLIGISNYQEQNGFQISPLRSAVDDADKMDRFFRKHLNIPKKRIVRLSDEQATKAAILKQLDKLARCVKKGDQVLIYYSGHGEQIPDDNGDEIDQYDEVLVSYDATYNIDTGLLENLITDDEMNAALQKIEEKGASTVVISDACHSGSITRNIQGVKTVGIGATRTKDPTPIIKSEAYQQHKAEMSFLDAKPYRTEWSAASAGQLAYENLALGGGVFTRFFLEGVQNRKADQNDDGIVSNSELIHFLHEKSQTFCKNNAACSSAGYGLTPTLTIAENRYGEAVFAQAKDIAVVSEPAQTTEQTQREAMLSMLEQTLPLSQPDQLSVSIVEGEQLNKGQELFVKINSKQAGYLILLDLDATGELVQVFPNRYHEDNAIEANNDYYVPENALQPYAMVADEAGKSHLYAIVTFDKIALSDVITRNKDLNPVPKSDRYVSEIASRLNRIWQDDLTNRASNYSVARFDYIVK